MAKDNTLAMIVDIEEKINYFNQYTESIKSKMKDESPKSIEEVKEKVLNNKVDIMLYNIEASYLFSELMFSIMFLKSFTVIDSEIINKFIEDNKEKIYKRRFHLEKGEIVENEVGFLEKQRAKVLESEDFKKTVEMLEKISPQ